MEYLSIYKGNLSDDLFGEQRLYARSYCGGW